MKKSTVALTVWYAVAVLVFVSGIFSLDSKHNFFDIASKSAEFAVLAAGLFSVLLVRDQLVAQEKQLQENHQQMVDDHHWKTIVSYHELFRDGVPSESIRKPMYDFAVQKGFIKCFDDLGDPMPAKVLAECISDTDARQIIRPYLDEFEKFCGAVNAGIVNENYALSLQGTRVIRNFTVFKGLIKHFQRANGLAYVELEKLATKWAIQRRIEEQSRRNEAGVGPGTNTRIRDPM